MFRVFWRGSSHKELLIPAAVLVESTRYGTLPLKYPY